jgi:hypothetical protein
MSVLVLLAFGTPLMGQSGVLMLSANDSLYYVDLKTAEYRTIDVQLNQPGESLRDVTESATANDSDSKLILAGWLWLHDSTVYLPVMVRKVSSESVDYKVYAVHRSWFASGTVTLGVPLYEAPRNEFPTQYRGFTLVPFRWSGDSAKDCLLTRGGEVIDTIYRVKKRKPLNDSDVMHVYSGLILDTNLLNNRIDRYRAWRGEPMPSPPLNDTAVIFDSDIGSLVVAENGVAIDTISMPCEQIMMVKEGRIRLRAHPCVSNVYNGHVAVTMMISEIDPSLSSVKVTHYNRYLFIVDITKPCSVRVYSTEVWVNNSIILLP